MVGTLSHGLITIYNIRYYEGFPFWGKDSRRNTPKERLQAFYPQY